MKRHIGIASIAAAGLLSLSTAFAHDNIAARYVVPDDKQKLQRYSEEAHGPLDVNSLQFNRGWYLGIGAGATHLDPEGQSGGFSTNDDSDSGAKLTIGQHLWPHWGWEYAYLDAGKAGLGNSNPAIANETVSYDIHSLFANYYLRTPDHDLNFIGKLGISTIDNSTSSSTVNIDKQTNAQIAFGLAAHWRFGQRWFVRVEHDRYDRDAHYTGASIGLYLGGHDSHE